MRHIVVAVNVTMFGTFGEKFQDNLEQNPQHDENPNVVIMTFCSAVVMAFVDFG